MQLAKAYVDSLPALPEDHHRGDVIDDFLSSFFEGITIPGAWIQSGTDADRSGLKAGQEYRRANPGKLKETMEGFGYNAIESEGMWTSGFEHSGFRPFDQPTERWWLSYMGLTFDGGMLSAHSHFVIRLAKTLFAGMDIGVALLLFASGDLIRAFARPKTSGTG